MTGPTQKVVTLEELVEAAVAAEVEDEN